MYPLKLNTYLIVFGLRRVFHIGDEFGSGFVCASRK